MVQISNYKIIFTEKHFLNKFKISFELCIPQRVIKGEHNNNLYEIKRRKLCNAQAVSHNRNKLRIKSHSNFHVIMATSHTQWVHLRLNSVPCLLEGAIQDFRIPTWGTFAYRSYECLKLILPEYLRLHISYQMYVFLQSNLLRNP